MRNLLTILLVLLNWTILFAQNDSIVRYDSTEMQPLEISEDDLQQFLNDDAFNYEVAEPKSTWWDAVTNWFYNIIRSFFKWIFGVENAGGYLAIFLKILPYLLLAIFLYLVIRFFIKANTRSLIYNEKNPNMVILSEEERIIKTEDIQQLIKEALAEKNYRLAVRYYYLFILKLLSEREMIAWQRQKTNDDYSNELSGSPLKQQFNRATLLYDYIWYGEFQIDQDRYSKVEEVFVSLKNSIGSHG
ncbi:DUF4129 domain-containing protein [Flagellimonas aequoris]|uniref:DUF4129 domain-containing protein n=1 Tax=Flagellimonas aequoris TaxID=2306997 RepID=A0A418N9F9_9FLAO|nr:DUF4129 domain-containing protein [Allomuricauda aequoris]RIV72365.1 DUF4129 domain-containing protein [Allomuricauda aequoris]TXK04391.1 DUF4129 domain-containing protein [Allomuricauda aequoris]